MKRFFVLSLAVVLAVIVLAGCQRSDVATNFGDAVIEWKKNEGKKQSNTIIDNYPDGDMGASLGFDVVNYPSSAAMTPDMFFAIDNWVAQIQYKASGGRDIVVRAARDDARTRNLRYLYAEAHDAEEDIERIDGVEVTVGLDEQGCTLVNWQRGGYQYTVHSNERQDPLSDAEIEAFVEGLICRDVEDSSSGS